MKLRLSSLALALLSTACVTIRPVTAPASFIPRQSPEYVWVQQQDGELYQVARPAIHGDTLVGLRFGTSEPVNLALPHIRTLSAKQIHRTRTTLFIATTAFVASFVVWRALEAGSSGSRCQYLTDNNEWICPN